jgi:hypothetical protein
MQRWENSKEFEGISSLIGKNRKLLASAFEEACTTGDHTVSTIDARNILQNVLGVDLLLADEKMKVILGVAYRDGKLNFKKFLDVYKDRFTQKCVQPKAF